MLGLSLLAALSFMVIRSAWIESHHSSWKVGPRVIGRQRAKLDCSKGKGHLQAAASLAWTSLLNMGLWSALAIPLCIWLCSGSLRVWVPLRLLWAMCMSRFMSGQGNPMMVPGLGSEDADGQMDPKKPTESVDGESTLQTPGTKRQTSHKHKKTPCNQPQMAMKRFQPSYAWEWLTLVPVVCHAYFELALVGVLLPVLGGWLPFCGFGWTFWFSTLMFSLISISCHANAVFA